MHTDTHTHLGHVDHVAPADHVERAAAAGVTRLVTVGTDVASSEVAVEHAAAFDGVHAVVGIHPNDAQQATDEALARIEALLAEPDVVGVGETGMDLYRDWCPPDVQEASFRAHVDLATRHDRTLVVHCRDAWDRTIEVLLDQGAPDRVVLHCFSGDADVVATAAEHGWFCSFAGNVTFRNAQPLRDAAALVPAGLLLTETDSPYLTPVPHRGRPNDSGHVPFVVAELARVQGRDEAEVAAACHANAARAFGLAGRAAA